MFGALATLVEIRMRRNEHASDCLFGFAVEFDGLPNDDSGSEKKDAAGCCWYMYVRGDWRD